jgi:hypothetical protein
MTVTHVIVPSYPLTDFLFAGLRPAADVRTIEHPLRPRRPLSNLLRAAEVYLLPWLRRSLYLDPGYVARLRSIQPEDIVLFFAIENRKDLQLIRKFVGSRRQVVWLWNPISRTRGMGLSRRWYLHWLRRSGMRAYTFDPDDARDGGIGLAPQVYRQLSDFAEQAAGGAAPARDVFFLGADKGRLPQLRALKEALRDAGLSTHFHVIADKRGHYTAEERACLATQALPYAENLRQVARSRAVLELLQSCQSGPTIRSMEALFLNRKLITNNAALRTNALYHPSRVFILGEDDLADIRRFMDSPMAPLDPSVLEPHEIEHWIRQFRD